MSFLSPESILKKSKLLSSYTNCSANFAELTFSVDGYEPTHKTIHNNGLLNDPDYFMAGDKMVRHDYASIIKAKADNTELVLFGNAIGNEWRECTLADLVTNIGFHDFFLCLPKHEKAVLNCLNGGESQITFGNKWIDDIDITKWFRHGWYMHNKVESRIKPRKEKRAIGVNVKTGQTTSAYQIDEEWNYAVYEVRLNYGMSDNWQFIEIEVEV